MELRDTTAAGEYKEDMAVLRVGTKMSAFYNMMMFFSDSLRSTPAGLRQWGQMMTNSIRQRNPGAMPRPKTSLNEYVYKNHPTGKITVTDIMVTTDVTYEEDCVPQLWTISDSTRQVMGYTCQKAECDFRGRHYTAWFAADIPVSDGPWKFNGLPGLILDVYDSKMYFRFTAAGLRQRGAIPVRVYRFRECRKITHDTFVKSKKKEQTIINTQMAGLGLSTDGTKENKSPGEIEKY